MGLGFLATKLLDKAPGLMAFLPLGERRVIASLSAWVYTGGLRGACRFFLERRALGMTLQL